MSVAGDLAAAVVANVTNATFGTSLGEGVADGGGGEDRGEHDRVAGACGVVDVQGDADGVEGLQVRGEGVVDVRVVADHVDRARRGQ